MARPAESIEDLKESREFLNPANRPAEIQALVDTSFEKLVAQNQEWCTNGRDTYVGNLGINDLKLALEIIQKGIQRGQKEFIFFDLGAGNFQWGRSLAKTIQQNFSHANITVTIVSVTGERYDIKMIQQDVPWIVLHEIDAFKVEDLLKELLKRGLNLEDQVDLLVSSFCLLHLIDPLGTVSQSLNLLKPNTGVLLSNGCHLNINVGSEKKLSGSRYPTFAKLLYMMKLPFIIAKSNNYAFMVQRNNQAPCQIPVSYGDVEEDGYISYCMDTKSFDTLLSGFEVREIPMPNQNPFTCGSSVGEAPDLVVMAQGEQYFSKHEEGSTLLGQFDRYCQTINGNKVEPSLLSQFDNYREESWREHHARSMQPVLQEIGLRAKS